MSDFEQTTLLEARGPYSFSESVRFLEDFTPAAIEASGETVLRLAFVPDGEMNAAGVSMRPAAERDDQVYVRAVGDVSFERTMQQVRRILSLDHDGRDVAAVAKRDPVIERLWKRKQYLRPVLFNSPHEAAAWVIIGNRIRMQQAARIKAELARHLGETISIDGIPVHAFPAPSVLAELSGFPGLTERKVAWLRGVGEAAAAGQLNTLRIRSMAPEEALEDLQQMKGIGPFGAELILLRGAGEADWIPHHETRFSRAVEQAYGLDEPPTAQRLEEMADAWKPFRTWVAVLLRSVLE